MNIKNSIFALILFVIPVFGFAQTANDPVMCTMQYQPVCALKQVQCITAPCNPVYQTYGNACQMNAAKATFVHDGECTGNEPAPGSNQTYVPPANCVAYYDGCNSCAKQANGMVACTLRACTTQQAGYCTKYAATSTKPTTTSTTTVITSTTTVVTNPGSVTEVSVVPTEEVSVGFWSRFMNWFKHLFGR